MTDVTSCANALYIWQCGNPRVKINAMFTVKSTHRCDLEKVVG